MLVVAHVWMQLMAQQRFVRTSVKNKTNLYLTFSIIKKKPTKNHNKIQFSNTIAPLGCPACYKCLCFASFTLFSVLKQSKKRGQMPEN